MVTEQPSASPPRPIPWGIIANRAELITELGGITLREYYLDGEKKLRAHIVARERFQEWYGLDVIPADTISASPPSYTAASVFGVGIFMPEDSMSLPDTQNPPLKHPSQVYDLRLPASYAQHPAMTPYVQMYNHLQDRVGSEMRVSLSPGTQGIVTTAVFLRGQDFFSDLVTHRQEAHRLLQFVTEMNIAFIREVRALQGLPIRGGDISVGDDYAGLMSPAMYGEFVVPCYNQFYEAFGADRRLHHSELLRPGHLSYLDEMGVEFLNLGENQYMTPGEVLEATDVWFEWHVKTSTLLTGTPRDVREEYETAIAEGAPAMITELCARGIPEENIRTYIETADEHGPMAGGAVYEPAKAAARLGQARGVPAQDCRDARE